VVLKKVSVSTVMDEEEEIKYIENNKEKKREQVTLQTTFDSIFITARNIRYIHLPAHINLAEAMNYQVEKVLMARKKYSRGIRRPPKNKPSDKPERIIVEPKH